MKNHKILIIDDDTSIRYLLNHLLADEYETEIVENGFDALAMMQNGNIPDLIISDLSMPKMDGNDFISNIKTSSFFNQIPVIVLSANDSSSERINCLKKGAHDFLVKPFNPEELLIRVKNILSRTKATI
jgi:DNA-binding response OmpR family regulator